MGHTRKRVGPRRGPLAMGYAVAAAGAWAPSGARLLLAHAGPWAPAGTRLPFGRNLLPRHGPGRTVGAGRHREARRPTRDTKADGRGSGTRASTSSGMTRRAHSAEERRSD